jgi:hypothetical protein
MDTPYVVPQVTVCNGCRIGDNGVFTVLLGVALGAASLAFLLLSAGYGRTELKAYLSKCKCVAPAALPGCF